MRVYVQRQLFTNLQTKKKPLHSRIFCSFDFISLSHLLHFIIRKSTNIYEIADSFIQCDLRITKIIWEKMSTILQNEMLTQPIDTTISYTVKELKKKRKKTLKS